ncbi:LacI family DNA-binding transcriptional regulator [Lihuaxuella thermophila]|uniref:DNA-binding transcriptional regulator, LacI/PurR family n=1 Tax=Lihuaxuella thermophila TaxID=1173111 RepID=A0A1H8DG49_9BACL|nr:LacI family DNA-binding transcriptional regulator [Lihuaxuella thermophila]SEN06269.1 DNA-binding transcriptional regulator, LacI/PurR family [Lihuaxuella thermophila]
MATIKDVAKLAAVSPSTVSRVIAGSNRISLETKMRVHRAMEQLNYVPNAIARSLARSHTRTIGFTLARQADQAFSNPFFPEVMRGMSSVAQTKDYNILLSISRTAEEEKAKCLQLIRERRVDGLIVSTSRAKDPLIDALIKEDVPFVLIGRSMEKPVLSVNNDNVQAARLATSHLIQQGYHKIAFISGDTNLVVSLDRIDGYKQALIEHNLPLAAERIVEADFSIEGGFQALNRLKQSGVEFDAVMAADDLFALGALKFAEHYGLKVPEELGIVGFNDSPLMSFIDPPLTSVKILAYELGTEAMELLLNVLDDPEKARTKKEIVIASELIIRKSSQRCEEE